MSINSQVRRAAALLDTSPVLFPDGVINSGDRRRAVGDYSLALASSSEAGIVYRYADSSNYWRAYIDGPAEEVKLTKRVAGVETLVASAQWTPKATAELRVIWQGTRHRVWIDGKIYIDTTDSALGSNTKVGLYSKSSTGHTFDDFYAEAV